MADMNEIDLDVEAIRSSISSVALSINDADGNYSGEWMTTVCISSAFQIINKILTDFESAKGVLSNHLDELDTISTEATSKVSWLSAFLSRFTSRRKNSMPSNSDMTALVDTQNGNLNVRSNPGTNQPITATAMKGSTVKVLEEDKGSGWTKVELDNGTTGYVSTAYLRMDKSASASTQQGGSTTSEPVNWAPSYQQDIRPVTSSGSTTGDPANWAPSYQQGIQYGTQQQFGSSSLGTAYVNTHNAGLNIRTGKGTDTAIKTSAAKGSALTIIEKDDGSGWTKVRMGDGTTGYVSSTYLSVDPSYGYSSGTSSPSTSSSSGNLYRGTAYVNTNTSGLNLRSSVNGSIITSIPKGAKVEIGETVNGWTKVKYNGQEGYVSTRWLSEVGEA